MSGARKWLERSAGRAGNIWGPTASLQGATPLYHEFHQEASGTILL